MDFLLRHWMGKLCLAGLLVLSLNLSVGMAADYFVSTNGNDGNPGTLQRPFRTLERGLSALASGDRLLIRGGTYQRREEFFMVPSGSGSWETATTIKAYNDESVIITPFDPRANGTDIIRLPRNVSWVIFDGLTLDGRGREKGMGGRMAFRFGTANHHIRIINTEMRYTYTNIIYTFNATHNEFINLNLHHGNHNLPPDNPRSRFRVYGIYMSSEGNLVRGCDIHHNRGHGITNYSEHDFKPNNNTFIGNHIHDNEMTGLLISTGVGVKAVNNIIYGNGTGASSGYAGWNRWGIQVDGGASDVLIYHNTMYNNPQGELNLGGWSFNVMVRNNIFTTNAYENVVWIHQGSVKPVVENNLIVANGENTHMFIRNWEPTGSFKDNLIGNHADLSLNNLFKNLQEYDFHLTAESSARGIGLSLEGVETDFDGIPRTLTKGLVGAYGVDVGAYQYVEEVAQLQED